MQLICHKKIFFSCFTCTALIESLFYRISDKMGQNHNILNSIKDLTTMAWIEIIDGPFQGVSIAVNGKLTIGRNTCNDLFLNDANVSRRHAEIWIKAEIFALIDLGSSNGTTLNKKLLRKLVPQHIYDNDEFVIGLNRFIFHSDSIPPEKVNTTIAYSDDQREATFCITKVLPIMHHQTM